MNLYVSHKGGDSTLRVGGGGRAEVCGHPFTFTLGGGGGLRCVCGHPFTSGGGLRCVWPPFYFWGGGGGG